MAASSLGEGSVLRTKYVDCQIEIGKHLNELYQTFSAAYESAHTDNFEDVSEFVKEFKELSNNECLVKFVASTEHDFTKRREESLRMLRETFVFLSKLFQDHMARLALSRAAKVFEEVKKIGSSFSLR